MKAFAKPLKTGKTDRYYIRLDPIWLGSAIIVSCTITNNTQAVISVGAYDIDSDEIGFFVTGLIAGSANIHIDFVLSDGRSDCKSLNIYVQEC